jgi:hypothetical protein
MINSTRVFDLQMPHRLAKLASARYCAKMKTTSRSPLSPAVKCDDRYDHGWKEDGRFFDCWFGALADSRGAQVITPGWVEMMR